MAKTNMRVCDYIAEYLYRYGVKRVYGITGGGNAGISDGIAKAGKIEWIATHHEQGAAYAAIGESKLTGQLSVVMPTTGCGGTNCVTGVLSAYQDSVPVLFISGNVNRAQMTAYKNNSSTRVRKQGIQEADIVTIVSSIVKDVLTVDQPEFIIHDLRCMIERATSGRKGPVWLDIPTDIQCAIIEVDDEEDYKMLHASVAGELYGINRWNKCVNEMASCSRVLILAGNGIKQSFEEQRFRWFIQRHNIPFVATYGAIDIVPSDHPLFIGRVGVKGDRAGNFALYNCDYLIVLGSSLATPITGYNLKHFAPHAKNIVVVDIENPDNHVAVSELGSNIEYINTGLWSFFRYDAITFESNSDKSYRMKNDWVETCQKWRDQWPVCLPEYANETGDGINIYQFVKRLSEQLPEKAAVCSDAGSSFYACCQSLMLKEGQRHIQDLAQAGMGASLPMSVGVALQGVPTIVVVGDGSFQTNIQELATIRYHKLPIKIFVLNNQGYLSCKATQNKLFNGNLIGNGPGCGLWFPELINVALTYGMQYWHLTSVSELDKIGDILSRDGPAIIEVTCPEEQLIIPTIGASRDAETGVIRALPLADMHPSLPIEEIKSNMKVPYERS